MNQVKSPTEKSAGYPWFNACLWTLICTCCLSSCYEPREGCLDILATNFAVDADVACRDCCTWPELRIRFFHQSVYPDSAVNFRLQDSVYNDIEGSFYRVSDFRFLLSNFRLVRPDGSEEFLVNRIATRSFLPDGSLMPDSITNDILLIRPLVNSLLDVGNFRAAGRFVALRFDVGLSEPLQHVDPASLPPAHPMNPTNSGMSWNRMDGYEIQQVELLPGSTPQDTMRVEISLKGLPLRSRVELPISLDIPEGRHLELDLRVDYRKWLSGIGLNSQTEQQMLQNLYVQTPEVFRIQAFRYSNN